MDDNHRQMINSKCSELVEGTNDIQLEKILQIFEEKKLLNEWMLQKIRNGENKQKEFYEMVPKRGPQAFQELLNALDKAGLDNLRKLLTSNRLLHRCENEISNFDRDEIDGNSLSRSRNTNRGQNCNGNLEKSTVDCEYPKDSYVVKSGIMLIINNKEFPFKKGLANYDRHGSEKDVENLESFGKAFGFEVKIKSDLKSEDFKNYLNIFVQKKKLKEADSLIVFFMSHGRKVEETGRMIELECPDNKYVQSAWLLQQFDAINCPALAGKPKAIFFVACRGENWDTGFTIAADNSISIKNTVKVVPKLADLFVAYSTSPDFLSMRDYDGTTFIKTLMDVLAEKTHTHLQEVINEVSQVMRNATPIQVIHWEAFGFDKKFPLNRK